jgi:hypothetical protein
LADALRFQDLKRGVHNADEIMAEILAFGALRARRLRRDEEAADRRRGRLGRGFEG